MVKLLGSDGVEYLPTATDRLWLARAVEAEGEPKARVAETLVNGFMWARSELGYERPLATWIRSYSQPVNPRWFVRGDLHLDRVHRARSDAEAAELTRHALIRETVHATRLSFRPDTQAAVEGALAHAPELPSATDFAASFNADGQEIRKSPPWKPVTAAMKGRNRFWTRPAALGWAGYRVSDVAVNGAVVLLCALAIYAIWRST